MEWLKAVGFYHAALTKQLSGVRDRKSYVLAPTELDLAARKAVKDLEGSDAKFLDHYSDPKSDKYCAMVKNIGKKLNLTSLKYQTLDDLVAAIGLPAEKLCTYCWNGRE